MPTAVQLTDRFLKLDRNLEIAEQFPGGLPAGWTGAGTVTALSERGGGISLATTAIDNAVASLTLAAKPFVLAANKPISFAARVQYAEAATNAANVFVGLFSEAVATAVGDNGAGPPASYSGFGFFKVDGGTRWQVEASVGATQDTTELTASNSADNVAHNAGGASYVLLEIDVIPKTASKADVHFKMDGVLVKKLVDWTYTSIAAMAPVAVVKAGAAAIETLKVNLVKATQPI